MNVILYAINGVRQVVRELEGAHVEVKYIR